MEYNPKAFKIETNEKALEIAKEISFASLIYQKDNKIESTQLPVLVDIKAKKIHGHFAKANPMAQSIDKQKILVTFQGAHGLIKPQWYHSDEKVPTWNYVSIHVRGQIKLFEDEERLKDLLLETAKDYKIDDLVMPPKLLKGIIGFELVITEVEGKAKLGQTKSRTETEYVIKHLRENGNKELADAMEATL